MSLMKEMQFPVAIRWQGGRLVHADSRGKAGLALATPPEFRTGLDGYWTPEDLLVTSVASCFALTVAAIAERDGAPLLDATVTATGHMSRRDNGRFEFTVIEIDAGLETTPGGEDSVRRAAAEAEQRCLVTRALEVPVHITVTVEAVAKPAEKQEPALVEL